MNEYQKYTPLETLLRTSQPSQQPPPPLSLFSSYFVKLVQLPTAFWQVHNGQIPAQLRRCPGLGAFPGSVALLPLRRLPQPNGQFFRLGCLLQPLSPPTSSQSPSMLSLELWFKLQGVRLQLGRTTIIWADTQWTYNALSAVTQEAPAAARLLQSPTQALNWSFTRQKADNFRHIMLPTPFSGLQNMSTDRCKDIAQALTSHCC